MLGASFAFCGMSALIRYASHIDSYKVSLSRFMIGLALLGTAALFKRIRLVFVNSPLLFLRGFIGGLGVFFFYLSIPSIIWGIIYGSYFSLELGIPGLLNPSEDFMTILIISVILGGIQLFFGLAIKAYVMILSLIHI